MTLPGSTITQRDQAPPRGGIPTDTGTFFAAGLSDRGPAITTKITSMGAFEATYGARVSYSVLYDSIETFFKEGGSTAYIARVLGPSPVIAKVDLLDGTAPTLRVSAKGAGEYGNSLNVAVEAGDAGEFVLVITDDVAGELERSPSLASTAEAITWSAGSSYVTASELAGTDNPVVAAAAGMTGGADDRTNVTNTQRVAALAQFTSDLGPGQVAVPGATHLDVHTGLLTHAAANNRVALLDLVDTTSASTLAAAAAAVRALPNDAARHGAFFAPWANISGYAGLTSTRTVPFSAIEAGMLARVDAAGNPNVPAAGDLGISNTVLSFTATFTDAERETLNDAGVNVARMMYQTPKSYGFRTVANSVTSPLHYMLSNVRLDMAITAKAMVIAERYVFRSIDGKGITIGQFKSDLVAMLSNYYDLDALYGTTSEDAFHVEVGDAVNTPTTIAAGELRAVLSIKRSPFAERVSIEIVKVALSDVV